jgi:hypothetical protein
MNDSQWFPEVWVSEQARLYTEAAESLASEARVLPAVILGALGLEIFLKSLQAQHHPSGRITTERGHDLVKLFRGLPPTVRESLLDCSRSIDPSLNFEHELNKHNGLFEKARYWYEPNAPVSVGTDTVRFARHLYEVLSLVESQRSKELSP